MAETKKDWLKAEGYGHYTTIGIGLPHYVWTVDLDIESDRNLHLSEETVLKLIEAGVTSRPLIGTLMGIQDSKILRNIILNLLERSALEYDDNTSLRLSSIGKQMLLNARARVITRELEVRIRYDPYTDQLRWHKSEYDLNDKQLRTSGRKRISAVKSIGATQIEERYKEIQELIARAGLPKESGPAPRRREVLRVHALRSIPVYRAAELEIWHKREGHKFGWRVIRDGVEEERVARFLEQLQMEGYDIIPSEEAPTPQVLLPKNEEIHEVIETVTQTSQIQVLEAHEHRDALKQALEDAKKTLYIISPWLRTGAIDYEMSNWFIEALKFKPALRVVIGYGIEVLPRKISTGKEKAQAEGLRQLQKISKEFGGRLQLTEIGHTHEKIVICDEKYCIITSFNFLSFNPNNNWGPGVRREKGTKFSDPLAVKNVLESVKQALESNIRQSHY